MDDDMSMSLVFSNPFKKGFSEYFDGWERYGFKEKNGEMSEISFNEIDTVRMTMKPGDEVYIGPAEEVKEYYKLYQNITPKELNQHKDGDEWKPGRFVVENTHENHHVWVRYEGELKESGTTWAKVEKDSKVIHYDAEGDFERRLDSINKGYAEHDLAEEEAAFETSEEYAEHMKSFAANKDKRPANNMAPILKKVERYFEDHEFGVFKEAQGDKDGAVWKVKPTENTVGYLKAMNWQGKHIFIRPTFDKEDRFMMHDDLDQKGLEKHHQQNGKWKPGRMVVETSPGNYQVWIKSDRPLSVDEKKYWLAKMDSDPGASPLHRWGRSPGFRNRKAKYKTEKGYPLSRMVWVDWKNKARVPKIDLDKTAHKVSLIDEKGKRHPIVIMGKAETVEQKAHDYANKIGLKKGCYSVDFQEVDPDKAWEAAGYNKSNSPTKTTNISINQSKPLPTRADYYKGPGKESEQDFAYAMGLFRRNVSKDVVAQRISQERTDWTNHQGEKRKAHYLKTTIDNAEKKVLSTQEYNRGRSKREQGGERTKDQKADYKIIVKDIKNGRQKDFTLKNIPNKNAQATLNKDAKKAVASMGYKNTSNLEVSIQRLNNRPRNKIIEKRVSVNMQT